MNFKAITLGLAVASVATLSLAKPVAYQIDPTHTATVFSFNAAFTCSKSAVSIKDTSTP